jgi:hypothetical protein
VANCSPIYTTFLIKTNFVVFLPRNLRPETTFFFEMTKGELCEKKCDRNKTRTIRRGQSEGSGIDLGFLRG